MKNLVPVLALSLCCFAYGAEPEGSSIPASVEAAVATLAPETKPLRMKTAKNGAVYALLQNGCEIIVMEKHSAPVVAVQAWVRSGAMHEDKWMGAGLSHFCEHMLFKGTTKRPPGVLDQEIRGAGGDDNAYTNSERTVYHITTAREGFDVSFNALADMLMDSTFPPEETTKEHAVVVKEIERYQDDPDSVLWESFEATLYQEHPYRVPVLGYPDRFKKVTRDEVFAYYQQRYSPQMSTFIAVGDFDAGTALAKMAAELSKWERKSVAPVEIPPEPEQVAPRNIELTHPICEVPKLIMGFPTVSLRDPDLYALDILANILGDGRASRFYRTVKDKENLALEINAFSYTPLYNGWFGIFATAEAEKLEAVKASVMKVIEEAKTVKPTEEELARAKRKVFTQNVFSKMTAEGLAGDLGSNWFVAGDLDFSEHYTQRMQEVSADDVVRVAKKYLVPHKLTTALMRPEAKAAEAAKAPKDQAAEELARVKALKAQLETLRADPAVANAKLLEERDVFEFTLKACGVRVVVKEDHSLPVVHASLAALGGSRWEPAELGGAARLMSEMLDRGTQKRDKLKLAEESEGIGATLSTFSGRNSFGVGIKGLKQDLPKLMELAADAMLHPKFAKEELEQLRGETLQQIAQEDESLIHLNSKTLRPLLYGNHPYSRNVLGSAESVKKVTVEDLQKLHAAWTQPENIALSFVGDITALEALQQAKAHFADLKCGVFKSPPVPPVPELTEGKNGEASKADIKGAVLTMGFRGVSLKSPEREALDLISSTLSGLGGRLFIAFREKEGLSYAVGAYNDTQLDGGAFVFYVQTDAKSLDRATEKMWDEVKRLRDEPIAEKELVSIRKYLAGTEAIELQDQGSLAQRLALAQLYDEGALHVFTRKARLEKLDAATIQAVAKKYLDPAKYAKAILKPK